MIQNSNETGSIFSTRSELELNLWIESRIVIGVLPNLLLISVHGASKIQIKLDQSLVLDQNWN
jgi:hypothetical protein